MTQPVTPGARWLRCDLHVHTPFDRTKRFGDDVRAAVEAADGGDGIRFGEMSHRFLDASRGTEPDLLAVPR